MSNLEKRIEKLETRTGVGKREKVNLVVVTGGLNREAADAKVKAAREEYLTAHPECVREDIFTIAVTDEEAKQGLNKLLEGKMPTEETRQEGS